MAVQLSLNQGPQDKLLFDNSKSYFTNVGYQRTSNFQMQLRDIDPQNAANFGQTVSFIIPKAADLLGPVDLVIEFNKVEVPDLSQWGATAGQAQAWGWVDNVGYAMIEKITFSVGSHDVETLTGESLNIINELMRNGNNRYGFHQTLKTGLPLFKSELDGGKTCTTPPNRTFVDIDPNPAYTSYDRIISYKRKHYLPYTAQSYQTDDGDRQKHSTWWDSLDRPASSYPHSTGNWRQTPNEEAVAKEGKHLCIPLGLFFTSHPSKYFPIAAIAGCNDIRVTIKFRQVKEVLMQKGTFIQNADANSSGAVYDWISGPQARDPQTGASMGAVACDPARVRKALTDDNNSAQTNFYGAKAPGYGNLRPKYMVISSKNWLSPANPLAPAGQKPDKRDAVFLLSTIRKPDATNPDQDHVSHITGMTQIRPGNFNSDDRSKSFVTFYADADGSSTAAGWNVAAAVDSDGNFTTYGSLIPWDIGTGYDYPLNWAEIADGLLANPGSGYITDLAPVNDNTDPPTPSNGQWFNRCQLRCHYVHVTGPEATALMGKEHVRLMKLMDDTNHLTKQFSIKCSTLGTPQTLAMDLNFLHPIQEIIITIRKLAELGSSTSNSMNPGWNGATFGSTMDLPLALQTGGIKNYFAYHGGGRDPNPESWTNSVSCADPVSAVREPSYLQTTTFQLKLNGQSRHLDGQGIDREYLMNRLLPMIHSSARDDYQLISDHSELEEFELLSQMMDRKEIYVYPFALNPEGANPSGSVNFSKVSHARLEIGVNGFVKGLSSATATIDDDYIVDVYGVYYNWLAIKDGRALTSFA
jgi:hypothetical protein